MSFNIEKHLNELVNLRHQLHAAAEVSGEEEETSEVIKQFLEDTSPDSLETRVGGHGILAIYEGAEEGPHVLIRCELDALPISDINDIEYRSKNEGVGHKCGHDGHMAIVCGVARLLEENQVEAGKVTLLFQPAEETGEGAQQMIEDSQLQHETPDYCFALHNLPGFKKHQIIVRDDVFAAASVGLVVNFKGATAHAAHPEQGRSPALAMAQAVQAFSAAPQFYSPLDEAAKVTVINANLGERAFGTSPGEANVMATLRTYNEEVLSKLKEKCIQIAKRMAETYDLSVDTEWVEEFPSTVNNKEAMQIVTAAAQELNYEIHPKKNPFSWSEDFGHFTNLMPGAMFGLGIGDQHPSLHAGDYDFEDEVLSTGIEMFMQIIKEVTNSER